jgi:hypothetical protein
LAYKSADPPFLSGHKRMMRRKEGEKCYTKEVFGGTNRVKMQKSKLVSYGGRAFFFCQSKGI